MSTQKNAQISRILTVLFAVIMFSTAFTVLSLQRDGYAYGTGETGQITASTLYVRSGPGTSYSKIGSMKKGKTFTVTGTGKDKSGVTWYKMKYGSKNGYVSSKYVYIKHPTVTAVSNTKGTVNTKKDPLTVRSGPGASYRKLGSLAKSKTFTITGKATDSSGVTWYRLTYSGKTGYVSAAYVKTSSTSNSGNSGGTTVTPTTNMKGTVNTKSDPLTVRSGAGANYSRLGTLAKGKTFDITGQASDSKGVVWYQLDYNSKKGYVSSRYVKATDGSSDNNNNGDNSNSEDVTFQVGTVITSSSPLNVRSGAGSSYSLLGTLSKGSTVLVTGSANDKNGKVWYKYQFSSAKDGYICSDYVKLQTVTSDSSFESYMTAQGFPESYKSGLRVLHAMHPNWTFKALKVGVSWSQALNAETASPKTNLVSPSSPVRYRSTEPGAYNSSTKTWSTYDGGWYPASKTVVAYYMDPRNFLNDNDVYQFMTHSYDSSNQSASTVAAVVKGTFMETRKPGGSYSNYASLINAVGKASGVNPNVLAAMIVQEQGTKGTSSLISGTYSGYKGYYNFFNVGAFTTATHNKVEAGLIYAKNHGWNSVYNSIKGGADFYYRDYVSKKQNTYYLKKFNVNNGTSNLATHQYMTNVQGAAGEGSLVRKAFGSDSSSAVTFEIPVYNSMPSSICSLP